MRAQQKITLALFTGSADDITFPVQQAPSLFSPDSGDSGWCWPIFSVISANMHFVLVEAWRTTDSFTGHGVMLFNVFLFEKFDVVP